MLVTRLCVAACCKCCSVLQCVAVCCSVPSGTWFVPLHLSLILSTGLFHMCCNTCDTHVPPSYLLPSAYDMPSLCVLCCNNMCCAATICVVLQQTAHATTQPCHTQTDFDCGLDQFRTEQFVPGLRCYDEMRLGLRKLVILHELILSRKIRISKSVYCDTHMPAAYVLPFLYDMPSSYVSCCNKQHTLRLSHATF